MAADDDDHQQRNGSRHISVINPRKHINAVGHEGTACGNPTKSPYTTCKAPNGHRCAGSRGGHVDLVAWDVIETIHNQTTTTIMHKQKANQQQHQMM